MSGRPKGRRPGSSGAREQILRAARDTFAELGYDRASMRLVASRAGVDPALIHHYFGTKEGLLQASLRLPFDPEELFAGITPGQAGEQIVRRILTVWEENPAARQQYVALMRTALSNEQAAAIMRTVLAGAALHVLESIVSDRTAPLRAALIGTQLGGLTLGRYVIKVPAIADASVEELVAAVGPAVQHYVDGPVVAG